LKILCRTETAQRTWWNRSSYR